jgi:spore coat protein U-like protein
MVNAKLTLQWQDQSCADTPPVPARRQQTIMREPRAFAMLTRAKRIIALGFVLAAACGAPLDGSIAQATQQQNSSFTVSVTIAASCTISATPLAFVSPGALTANVDQTSSISITCTNTTPYTVGLDNGVNFSSGTRRMKDTGAGTTFVNYGLYTDSAHTNAWTTTTTTTTCTGGANTCAIGTGTGSNQPITVYGRIPPQTAPAPATFQDTVTATVTY